MFVDKCATNTSLSPLYAYSPKERAAVVLFGAAQLGHEHHAAFKGMSIEGMGPCLAVESSTIREVFEAYVELVLAPSLRPGHVVAMDNLSSHKGGRVSGLIEERGCELVYLPPYSPDLNPI